MAVSSLSITSVNLYAEAARTGRGERRERPASTECAPCAPPPQPRGSKLADAMRDAFEALGWTQAENSEAPESVPSTESEAGTSLDDAVAEFASALAQALKDVGRGGSRGDGCGGRHGHHGRSHGMAPRIELLVVQVQAGAPAPAEAGEATPVALPAPAPEPVVVDTTPAVATEEQVAAAPAATEPAEAVATEPEAASATEQPLAVAPPPAPEAPGGLVDAFKKLLDSLRDNGVSIPEEEPVADALVRFLNQLAEGLRGSSAPAPSRFDTQPVFSGTFVRIVV